MIFLTKLVVVILLFLILAAQETRSQRCHCGESKYRKPTTEAKDIPFVNSGENSLSGYSCPEPPGNIVYLVTENTTSTGLPKRSFLICCCDIYATKKNNLLSVAVKWTYNGKPLNDSDWEIEIEPKGPAIYGSYVTSRNSGIYGCQIGNQTRYLNFHVLQSEPNCGPPKNAHIQPIVYKAMSGADVSWICSAFVGEQWQRSQYVMKFYRRLEGEELISIKRNVQVNISIDRMGELRGELRLLRVAKNDFGNYFCLVSNYNHRIVLNFSLVEGVSDHENWVGQLRTLITVLCASSAMAIIVFSYWLKCRVSLALLCKDNAREAYQHPHEGGFLYDIFVIHGVDSERWVTSHLLPVIERGAKYSCFVPPRDLTPGKSIAEQISRIMDSCRRALIVATPLLLEGDWSSFASHSAVSESLLHGGRSKIIVVQLEEMKAVHCHTSKDLKLLKLLSNFPTIIASDFVRSCWLTADESDFIVGSVFVDVFQIRNSQFKVQKSYASSLENGEDLGSIGINDSYKVVMNPPYKANSITIKLWRLLLFQLRSALLGDETHQFWNRIFYSLPPSPKIFSSHSSYVLSQRN